MTDSFDSYHDELEKRYRNAAFVVLAQMFFALSLFALIWIIPVREGGALDATSRMTLWIGALFVALGTFLMRRLLYRWDRLKDIALLKNAAGVLQTLQTNAIILGAMAELVAVLGFIIAIMSGERLEMLRAVIIALIVFLINFPRKKVWEKIAANLEKV